MLHTRKLTEISSTLKQTVAEVEARHGVGLQVEALARDYERLGMRVDLSKSAARLRRRLYAQWRSPLVLHELVSLGPKGWGLREPKPDNGEVGDIIIDHQRLARGVRTSNGPDRKSLTPAIVVELLHAVLEGVGRQMKSGPRHLSANTVAVLWALHASESARRVKKPGAQAVVIKQLKAWGFPEWKEAAVDAELDRLVKGGFIHDEEGKYWRLSDEIRWGF